MSNVSRRVHQELLAAQEELVALRLENLVLHYENQNLQSENIRLTHETHLAYLEGVDQGRALAYAEAV